jgi:thymidylate synthase
MEIDCDNIPLNYPTVLRRVIEEGQRVSPRGLETVEVRGLSLVSKNPRKRFISHPSRNANPVFPIVELMWYLSGNDTPEVISHYISAVTRYVNPNSGRFDGAYGPRLRGYGGRIDQLVVVYDKLKQDVETRRAVMMIFDPLLDNKESLNVPCNVLFQLLVRDGKLELIAYTRSQDMVKGFTYDTAEWQLLQDILAGWLDVDVGLFRLVIGSAHVYASDMEKVRRIIDQDPSFDLYDGSAPQSAGLSFDEFDEMSRLYYRFEFQVRDATRKKLDLFDMRNALTRQIDSAKNEFWENVMRALVVFNAYRAKSPETVQHFLPQTTNELRNMLEIWIKNRIRSK